MKIGNVSKRQQPDQRAENRWRVEYFVFSFEFIGVYNTFSRQILVLQYLHYTDEFSKIYTGKAFLKN